MGVFNGAAMLHKVLECDTTTEDQIRKCGPATFFQALKCGRSMQELP